MKNITIAGRTGKEAELRRTNSGDPVLSFSLAVDDGYGQNKKTLWFDVSVWGKRAEALASYLPKGTAVAVAGDISTREHDGRTYLTVRANEVTLQGGKETKRQSGIEEHVEKSHQRPLGGGDLDDEIPFACECRL